MSKFRPRFHQRLIQLPVLAAVWAAGLVIITALMVAREYQQAANALENSLEATAAQRALLLAHKIQADALSGNWTGVTAMLEAAERYAPGTTSWIVSSSGDIAASSPSAAALPEAALQSPNPVSSRWASDGQVLVTTANVARNNNAPAFYLILSSNHQSEFTALRSRQGLRSIPFSLAMLLLLVAGLAALVRFTIQPLRQVAAVSRAAVQEGGKDRAPSSSIHEINNAYSALNNVIDHNMCQLAVLERLNNTLEDKVVAQTHEILTLQESVLERASQIEEVHALGHRPRSVINEERLSKDSLALAARIAKADMAGLCLQDYIISENLDPAAIQAIERTAGSLYNGEPKTWVIPNWPDLSADHPAAPLIPLAQQYGLRSAVIVPVLAGSQPSGHLCVACSLHRDWPPDVITLLEMIANQLETVVERTHNVADVQLHNQAMQELILQSERLNQTLTQEQVVATVGEGALSLSKAGHLAVLARDDQGALSSAWSFNMPDSFLQQLRENLQEKFPVEGCRSTGPLLIPDLRMPGNTDPLTLISQTEGFNSLGVWPLVYEGRVNAIVCYFHQFPQPLSPDHNEILKTFFRQAAAALENARLYKAEHTQRRLAEALRDIAATLNSTLDLDQVLKGILDNLGRVVTHDTADIMVLEGGRLRIARWAGDPDKQNWLPGDWQFSIDEIPCIKHMLDTAQGVVVANTYEDPYWVRLAPSEWIRSYAAAPICQRGEVTGFINVNSSIPGFYNKETGMILEAFAHQAAVALENARLYHVTHQRMTETNALFRAIQPLIRSSSDIYELAQQITRSVTEEFSSAHCSILLVDEQAGLLTMIAQSGYLQLAQTSLPMFGPGITVTAARTGRIVYAPDVSQDPAYVPGGIQTRSELAIPLLSDDVVIGVLNLESPQIDAFDEQARRLMSSYAERAALALDNARLFATIREQATQMRQLTEITQTALKTSNSAQMLQLLTKQVAEMLRADGCYITLWEDNGCKTIPLAAFGPNQQEYPKIPVRPGEKTLTYSALQAGKTLVVEDVTNSPFLDAELAKTYPVQSMLALPMVADNRRIGAVLVGYIGRHHFRKDEIALGEQAAGQIALAMAKLRMLDIAERRAHEANNLRLATAALSSTLDLQQVLERILNHLEEVIQHDSACMFLLDDAGYYRAWAVKNIQESEQVLNARFPRSDQLLQEVEHKRRPVTLENAQKDPRFNGWGGTKHICSWMGVPLMAGSEFVGILTLDRLQQVVYEPEEVEIAQTFARQAAVAVQNARLYQATQNRARELEALHTATTSLVTTLDLQKLLERILSAAVSAIPAAQSAAFHLLDENHGLQLRAQVGMPETETSKAEWNHPQSPWAWVVVHRKPLEIGERSILPNEVLPPKNDKERSLLVAPLVQEERVLGVLTLASENSNAFTSPDLRLLISFASTATAAIHNAQLHSAVQYLAITDPLTGVYNRRGFYNLAGRVLEQSRYYNRPLSAIMMDIDFFKLINDQYGHDAGDVVLQTLAERFRKVLREADLICRYGGEEFAILLTESDLPGAMAAANRLYRIITDTPISTSNNQVAVTMSIGVACFDDTCTTLDDLLKNADKALYAAKEKGRNQVCIWNN